MGRRLALVELSVGGAGEQLWPYVGIEWRSKRGEGDGGGGKGVLPRPHQRLAGR
jgi:hypothetical protein